MAYQFNGFQATKPVPRLIDTYKRNYEAFFIIYDAAGNKTSYRNSKGINRLAPSLREQRAKAKCKILWEALNKGWNPLTEKFPKFTDDKPELFYSLDTALDFAMQIKRPALSKYSCYDYDGCVRFMKKAAAETGCLFMNVKNIERKDVRMIMATAKENNEWSNKARNKYLTIFKSIFSVMADEEIIPYSPAHKIKNEPEEETIGYKRVTDAEKEKIAEHLMINSIDFFEYLMFIYEDGIRRKETLLLKIQDFNLTTRTISIPADVAKTNHAREAPITDTILEILIRREIWNYKPSDYLFSNKKFQPGPAPYHPNTPTTWWKQLVQEELGIDCKMYSLKHKGADDRIEAGTDIDVLRSLYGHRSKQMTERYVTVIKDKYKKQLIDKAPVFSAKVVEMKKAQ